MEDPRPWYEIAAVLLIGVAAAGAIIYGISTTRRRSQTTRSKKGPGARA